MVIELLTKQMRKRLSLVGLLALAALLTAPLPGVAQLVIGQYEDEAPLRSWNVFGFQTAPSLGRGETSFAVASDSSAALTNPALLVDLPGFNLTLNGTRSSTALYQFSIVNTGVLATKSNLSLGLYSLDFGGFSYSYKGWAFAVSAALSEIYDRPTAYVPSYYQGLIYYTIYFKQTGLLRNYNFAVARRLGRVFRVGFGLNILRGEMKREIEEVWIYDNITIRDNKTQTFSGFYFNGGILAQPSDRWNLALVIRTPYTKKSPSTSALRYEAPLGGTDIKIEAEATNTYEQPFIAGLGACYKFSPRYLVTSDIAFFHWSSYRVRYFEEAQERHFRNIIKVNLGSEYSFPVRVFKQDSHFLFRLGLGLDRQPMRIPNSLYIHYTFGIGLEMKQVLLNLGYAFGREDGSTHSLTAQRLSLSLSGRV